MYPSKDDLRRNPELAAQSFTRDYDPDQGGWKADARPELKALETLNEEIYGVSVYGRITI